MPCDIEIFSILIEAILRIEVDTVGEAHVDDNYDAFDGQGRLCDVRGNDNFTDTVCGRAKCGVLALPGQLAVERHDGERLCGGDDWVPLARILFQTMTDLVDVVL